MKNPLRVVVILANPDTQYDNRAGVVTQLCSTFIERCNQRGIFVDLIDLYKEQFNPVHIPNTKDTHTIEYQIRIEKADIIVIFHPVWWGTMPAVLKGFCEKVFQSGFAYIHSRGDVKGLLKAKKAHVIAVSHSPVLKSKLALGNILEIQWKRAIFDICGISSKVQGFYNLRKVSEKQLFLWHSEMISLADSI